MVGKACKILKMLARNIMTILRGHSHSLELKGPWNQLYLHLCKCKFYALIKELKRRRQQRKRHKLYDWLNEGKQSRCPCGTHLSAFLWRRLSNNVTCSTLQFWRVGQLAAVNLSFPAFKSKPLVPVKYKDTLPISCNVTNAGLSQNTLSASKFYFEVTCSVRQPSQLLKGI